MKRKKLWIILVSVIVGIVALLTGGYFLTKLSSVSIEFRTRLAADETRLEEAVLDKVKLSGEFDYSSSILFLNTDESVQKIERDNPYVKVQQVIRKFPNKLHVYISERIPKYRVQDSKLSNKWCILDEEFKVLEIVTNEEIASEFGECTIELKHFKAELNAGEFLDKPHELLRLNNIMTGVYGKTQDYFAITAIDYVESDNTYILSTKSGNFGYESDCEIQIVGINDLTNKTFKAVSVYVEKSFEGIGEGVIDLSRKLVIISSDEGCKIKNV